MLKLYEKNESAFAIAWIVAYVVGSSVADQVSEGLGLAKSVTLALHLALSAALLGWIKANGLGEKYGFRKPFYPASRFLFYLPLAVVASMGLWNGVGMARGPVVAVLTALSMLCVGFLEEVIFRGFLFRGIAQESLKRAVIISSLTFAAGHIVNLLNGAHILGNICQVIYAVMVGFLLVFIFLRTASIVPCIVFHAVNNAVTAFCTGGLLKENFSESTAQLIILGIKLAIGAAYLAWVVRLPKRELPEMQ